ncbi:hydrocephalus-inducing protein homolog [Chiroxiphia lanceolata]|uniref:hydrocephalus-inducing protein homolog n=1 Tax=Chiroxiphia lanceolata TaxID=296741 RepID=UPI0013CF1155|nr:hydrocephalus-inducing protein homolog [Chiroxiphia lanceolata]
MGLLRSFQSCCICGQSGATIPCCQTDCDSKEYPTGPLQLRLYFAPGHGCSSAPISTLNDSIPPPLLQVFDVQPVSGVLQPGKSQQVPFIFFGHANIIAHVTALCRVEGGLTYEVELRGETSVLTYHLSAEEIDCGLQLFNQVTRAKVTLRNDGKVGFAYVVQSPSSGTADKPLPGVLVVLPNTASIEPGKEQVLKLYYLPGMPGVFCRTFQVQVGHLKPAEISLKGEAVFAGICLDLPWSIKGSEKYERLLKQAKEKLKKDKQDKKARVWRKARIRKRHAKGPGIVANTWLRMEMEQMLIKENALELQPVLISRPPEDTVFDKSIPQKLVKVELPEYILDMGTVVQGYSKSCTVKITNTWRDPVAVRADERALGDTGFSIYLEPVEFLIYGTSKRFQVNFASANLPVGKVDVLLPIKVEKGPTLSHLPPCHCDSAAAQPLQEQTPVPPCPGWAVLE